MKYFTADLHLAHPSVAAWRKYERYHYHDQMIIDKINARVGKNDELFILGDISSGSADSVKDALENLENLYIPPRKRHLILGNHEYFKLRESQFELFQKQFGYIEVMSIITLKNNDFVLSHLPCRELLDDKKIEGFPENAFDSSMKPYAPAATYPFYLHGHTHMGKDKMVRKDCCYEYIEHRDQLLYWHSLDVGVDGHNFFPWSEEEILNHFDIL